MKTIAIKYDELGKAKLCLEIKNVDSITYQRLLRETEEHQEREHQKFLLLERTINDLNNKITSLEEEIKVLKGEE